MMEVISQFFEELVAGLYELAPVYVCVESENCFTFFYV